MSETLPTITGSGVSLRFTFPFDRSMPRNASIVWRRQIGSTTADTWYADIVQSGEEHVVHEQVTFPGDTWAVVAGGALLLLHVATGEREQQVRISSSSQTAAETAAQAASSATLPPTAAVGSDDDDPELAAAIAASLSAAPQRPTLTALPQPRRSDKISEALALSRRLCMASRAMTRLQEKRPTHLSPLRPLAPTFLLRLR